MAPDLAAWPRAQRTRHPEIYIAPTAPQTWRFLAIDADGAAYVFGPKVARKPTAAEVDYAADRLAARREARAAADAQSDHLASLRHVPRTPIVALCDAVDAGTITSAQDLARKIRQLLA